MTGLARNIRRHVTATLALTALAAGCTMPDMPARPPLAPGQTAAAPGLSASPASQRARTYYAGVQSNLLSQGLMRSDGGGPDTPFNDRQLADNFVRIAMFDEYVNRGGVLVAQATESRLRRWDRPVRVAVEFSATVPPEQRVRDRASISAYVARIARVTGHPMRMDSNAPNFRVLILNDDERQNIGPRLEQIVPDIDPAAVRATVAMPLASYCVVFAFSEGDTAAYSQAVAVIRGEHPDLLRLLCIHEEIAQGMGLANDSPTARPSIFNDDEEFALLTRQDELMLKMLYDRRMRAGMTLSTVRPIAQMIARELIGGES
jgi:hypothetical protein